MYHYRQCITQREHELQAKIDELMLEFCEDEMSLAQKRNWGRHQQTVLMFQKMKKMPRWWNW